MHNILHRIPCQLYALPKRSIVFYQSLFSLSHFFSLSAVRLRADRLSLVKECISQCPTAYKQSTLLLSLARLLRVAGKHEELFLNVRLMFRLRVCHTKKSLKIHQCSHNRFLTSTRELSRLCSPAFYYIHIFITSQRDQTQNKRSVTAL